MMSRRQKFLQSLRRFLYITSLSSLVYILVELLLDREVLPDPMQYIIAVPVLLIHCFYDSLNLVDFHERITLLNGYLWMRALTFSMLAVCVSWLILYYRQTHAKRYLIICLSILIGCLGFVGYRLYLRPPLNPLAQLKKELPQGWKVLGTDSPNGNYALFQVFFNGTTANTVVIGSMNKTHVYGTIDSSAANVTLETFTKEVLTTAWSPDSRYLAVHNSTAKHSQLTIYKIHDEHPSGHILPIPDLIGIVQQHLDLSRANILSSGQLPVQWIDSKMLRVKIRLKTHEGTKSSVLLLHITQNDTVEIIEH